MTIAYPVTADGRFIVGADDETVARAAINEDDGATLRSARIAAALNYTQDLTDEQLTEDSAGTVLEDRDRLLAALKAIQANPNDPRAHRAALDVLGGR